MKIPFEIYCRAVGLYALLTLPALGEPVIYIISLGYVLIYGWFAWLAFTILYVIINRLCADHLFKFLSLWLAVIVSVAFAFQMLEVLGVERDVWNSGFLIFPIAAVITGWTSVYISWKKIRSSGSEYETGKITGQ